MQRSLAFFVATVSIILVTTVEADAGSGCPSDIRATVAQACPCGSAKNHGHYMKCIRAQLKQLKKAGCEHKGLQRAAQCANTSTCGKARGPIVCCTKRGRAKLTSAEKCTARSGRVMSGVASLCDATCSAP